jgi:hypothetical protein
MIRTTAAYLSRATCGLALAWFAMPSSALAAPINYGDFSGSSVMYLDVTETANTPGDDEPLFGSPVITGNKLDFDPAGFTATSSGGTADITDGQLNFTVMSLPGSAISGIGFRESGEYSLLGTGTAATQVHYGLGIGSIVALEVDGVTLASPVVLAPANAGGSDNLAAGTDNLTPWSLSLNYDVNAALAAAKVPYVRGATKIEVAIDNALVAISEAQSLAFIAKKDFMIDISTTPDIPEPTALALCGLALAGWSSIRRHRG